MLEAQQEVRWVAGKVQKASEKKRELQESQGAQQELELLLERLEPEEKHPPRLPVAVRDYES